MNTKKTIVLGFNKECADSLIGNILYQTKNIEKDIFEKIRKDFNKEERWGVLNENYTHKTTFTDTTNIYKYVSFKLKFEEQEYEIFRHTDDKTFIQSTINTIYDHNIQVATLVIDAAEFDTTEFAIENTIEQITLARACGIEYLIVAVSNMEEIKWKQDIFNKIYEELYNEIEHLNFRILQFVPVSSYTGLGIKKRNIPIKWYDDKSYLELLYSIKISGSLGGQTSIKSVSKYMCCICNCEDDELITSGYRCTIYIDKNPYKIEFTNVRNKTHKKYSVTGDVITCFVRFLESNMPSKILKNRIVIRDEVDRKKDVDGKNINMNLGTVGYGRVQ